MGLLVDAVLTFAPGTIAKAGDNTVIATFERRSTGAATAEKTTYSIAPGQPYVFANASVPDDPRVVQAPSQPVTLNPSDRRQTLVLRRTKSPAVTTMVLVNADVLEVDDKGNPVLDGGGQPLPSRRASGFIVVQG
jgi:hypothetical protein